MLWFGNMYVWFIIQSFRVSHTNQGGNGFILFSWESFMPAGLRLQQVPDCPEGFATMEVAGSPPPPPTTRALDSVSLAGVAPENWEFSHRYCLRSWTWTSLWESWFCALSQIPMTAFPLTNAVGLGRNWFAYAAAETSSNKINTHYCLIGYTSAGS